MVHCPGFSSRMPRSTGSPFLCNKNGIVEGIYMAMLTHTTQSGKTPSPGGLAGDWQAKSGKGGPMVPAANSSD